jgi:hypothetical protein
MTATASGLQVPAVPRVAPDAAVTAKASTGALAIADYGVNLTNTGSSGTIVLTLLAAASAAGLPLRIQILAAQIVQFLPQTGEKIYLAGSGVATKYLQVAGTIGNFVELYCDGEKYLVQKYSGVVTKEA